MVKVCKFGGTSMADGITIERVVSIVKSDPCRRYLVVSAPGKRYGGDTKVTDLLFAAHESGDFSKIKRRFLSIAKELDMMKDVELFLSSAEKECKTRRSLAFTLSRGEYLSAKIFASRLGVPFLDAEPLIRFSSAGVLDEEETISRLKAALKAHEFAVIPGFYGGSSEGVCVFERGGSDITGALVARAIKADLYENWSDVSGFLAADPNVVEAPVKIERLTYSELSALSRAGAKILHPDSISPVRACGIPVLFKSTFRPNEKGTYILPSAKPDLPLTGIAGGNYLLSKTPFPPKKTKYFFQGPFGEIFLAAEEEDLSGKPISLLSAVGRGMTGDAPARILKALASAGIFPEIVFRAAEEFLFSSKREDFARAVRAVYDEFFRR